MERVNSNVILENQSNQSQIAKKSEKCQLVKMVEQRYGIKIHDCIWICIERAYKYGRLPDWMLHLYTDYPISYAYFAKQETIQLSAVEFKTIEELYRVTNTVMFSNKHKLNSQAYNEPMKLLIPVIQIKYKKRTLFFRFDNEIINEMFGDANKLISGEGFGELGISYKHHKEYLEYAFSPIGSDKSCRTWEQIHMEKESLDKSDMLHSDYLFWKNSKLA